MFYFFYYISVTAKSNFYLIIDVIYEQVMEDCSAPFQSWKMYYVVYCNLYIMWHLVLELLYKLIKVTQLNV